MRRLGRLFGFLAVQLLLAFGLLEGCARVLDPLGVSYYPETARYLDTLVREEPIGYRNRPGLRDEYWGVPVEINSLGMRDRELAPERPPGQIRVLILGDSVPFGVGVRYEDSIPAQLERQLNQLRPGPWLYRTLNMGVPSYNTQQERIQTETLGLSLDPDVAVLLYAKNDLEDKMWVLERRAGLLADLGQRSHGAALLFVLGRQLRGLAADGGAEPPTRYREDSEQWRDAAQELRQLAALLSERDVPLLVTTQLHPEKPGALRLLRELSAELGVPHAQINPAFDPRWAERDPMTLRNSFIDAHANVEGCAVVARMLRESLEQTGFLDRAERQALQRIEAFGP